jgi:hypothetical protein
MNNFYITDCWKNVNLPLLIELKGNCDTTLIFISRTANYTFSVPLPEYLISDLFHNFLMRFWIINFEYHSVKHLKYFVKLMYLEGQ